ncbi:MAG: cupin domain-containing protein [Actinomycetota bacterium]|nr:cupin domain-containing protein [Actinomycetota bacterium]
MHQVNEAQPAFAALAAQEGDAYWTLGMLVVVKARGRSTGGKFSVCEFLCPPGYGPPLHVHRREDESFWVLEGRVRFRCGDAEFTAGPGSYVFQPLGVPHGFKVIGGENARLIHLAVPAGMEEFHAGLGVRTQQLTVPPPMPLDMERAIEAGTRYGMEVVGPPIE